MSDRWDVDTIEMGDSLVGEFDHAFRLLSLVKFPGVRFWPREREEIRDFVLELVNEIERLQTENIELRDDALNMLDMAWAVRSGLKREIDTLKEHLRQRDETIVRLADAQESLPRAAIDKQHVKARREFREPRHLVNGFDEGYHDG